jgi:hypothetical protein
LMKLWAIQNFKQILIVVLRMMLVKNLLVTKPITLNEVTK